ncbi:ribulose-phosphate 3-epimerase [Entomospira culicis]|nr:ribulose-phosphate 3-epimerase [Entomospira culicis]WDI38509.1 ribulose-phosphate 3-epimerase [Entomospira culicis]
MPILAPSLLSANFAHFQEALTLVHQHQAPWLHFDVMDGQFVPAITFGSQVVASLRDKSETFFDVHLMTNTPERHFAAFAQAGANNITFHIEATHHAHALVQQIHTLGVKAGIALNPATPLSAIVELLPFVDLVLVMSVNPGAGGQSMIPSMLQKVKRLQQMKSHYNYPYHIQIDGGINESTIFAVKNAGIDVVVAGSAFFANPKLDLFLQRLRS